jgi:hypothetical protein
MHNSLRTFGRETSAKINDPARRRAPTASFLTEDRSPNTAQRSLQATCFKRHRAVCDLFWRAVAASNSPTAV